MLWAFPGLYEKTSQTFRSALESLGGRLGIDPQYLAALMSIETAGTWSPSILNPITRTHIGLIQFSAQTAKNLGTTIEALGRMTAEEQLKYVGDYLSRVTRGKTHLLDTPEKLYMAVFYPRMWNSSPGDVVARRGELVYDRNEGLDKDGDGILTVGDVGATIRGVLGAAQNRPIPDDSDVGVGVASKTSVLSYGDRLLLDWQATDRLAERGWYQVVTTGAKEPYPFSDWRADLYAYTNYLDELKSPFHIIVTKAELDELLRWHKRLQQWQERFGPEVMKGHIPVPIPDDPKRPLIDSGGFLLPVAAAVTSGLIVHFVTRRR